jgi:hypothetical protein
MAYIRRKQWEAKVQAMAQLEAQAVMFSRPLSHAAPGPTITTDGERVQRVSTKNGLASLLEGKRRGGQ